MLDIRKCRELREKHPGMLCLFGDGDSYESYNKDAIKVGKICNLSVVVRDGVRVCRFAMHMVDKYLPLMVDAGEKIAIFDGVE
jgi:DNA mismatch repair protein MutS